MPVKALDLSGKEGLNERTIINERLSMIMAFIILFRPGFVGFIPLAQYAFAVLQVVFLAALAVVFVREKKKINILLLLAAAYCMSTLFQTLLNSSGSVVNWGYTTVSLIALCLYLNLNFPSYKFELLNVWQGMLLVYCFINLLTIVRSGFAHNALIFLGSRIGITSYVLLLIALSFMLDAAKSKRITARTFAAIAVAVANVLACNVSTAWVGMGLLAGAYAILNSFKTLSGIKPAAFFWAGSALSVGEVLFRFQELFRNLIVGILGRDLTLTGRTYIWDLAIEKISLNPLWGYGVSRAGEGGVFMGGTYWPMHNSLLQIIYEGGFIGLVAYLAMISVALKQTRFIKNQRLANAVSAAVFSFVVAGITSSAAYSICFFALVFLVYNLGESRSDCQKETVQ